MKGGDHEPINMPEEGTPCWCGTSDFMLVPNGDCFCHAGNAPCHPCETSILECRHCGLNTGDIDFRYWIPHL